MSRIRWRWSRRDGVGTTDGAVVGHPPAARSTHLEKRTGKTIQLSQHSNSRHSNGVWTMYNIKCNIRKERENEVPKNTNSYSLNEAETRDVDLAFVLDLSQVLSYMLLVK